MSRGGSRRFALGAALALALPCGGVSAQPRVEQGAMRLPAPGRSIVTDDDTTALVVNPAGLAFLPGEEFRWTGSYLEEAAEVPWQGHSIAIGLPIPIVSMATGLRMDLVNPPCAQFNPVCSQNYQWLTWGLAVGSLQTAAMGVTVQRTFSSEDTWNGLTSWSLGFASHPTDAFGLGFVAHNLNAPHNVIGGVRAGFASRSFDLGVAVRPFGTRAFELGLEGRYVDVPEGFWVPRIALGFDVGPIGRVRGDFSVSDPSADVWSADFSRDAWLATLSLAVYLNTPGGSMEAGAGTSVGSRLGEAARYHPPKNAHTEVAMKGWREPSGPSVPRYAARIEIEDTPDVREHVALLRKLWALADESTLDGVLFDLRADPASSLAHAQELRDAVNRLRQHGKRVMCHLEDASGLSLYTCAAANRILVHPAGGLRFAGLKSQTFYYSSLLQKLGIRADFVRIGAHKSAPEAFTRDNGSPTARRDRIDLLQQYERHVVAGIAAGRGLTVAQVRERIAKGPFVATEAKAAGLVDGYAFDDQLEQRMNEMVGHPVIVVDEPAAVAPRRFGAGRSVALVYASGDLVDGRSQFIPLVGLQLLGSYTLAETLEQARENPEVAAVVLRIESPGGSALAADVVWREVELTARIKPVVVSMGTVAASGGYYIAAAGSRIFANPLSITGSIGIYYGKADVAELMKKLGVSVEVYKTAPRADAESIFRPFTSEERRALKHKVRQFYDTFLSRVAAGRKLSKGEVDAAGQGRVWTGEQARQHHLVDELGGLRQALEYALRTAGLPADAPIIELPTVPRTLAGMVLGMEGVRADAPDLLPAELLSVARALAPFTVYRGDQPLALMETTTIGP